MGIEDIVKLIKESSRCVALTGAGISTLSGIRDFRGKDGIYNDFDADKIFDLNTFLEDPSIYYNAARDLIYNLEQRVPGIVHKELARLQKLRYIRSIITQNIDLLHTRAGSQKVIEIHGSPIEHVCLKCGRQFAFDEIASKVMKGNVPFCDECDGIIKPGIIFFGEMLDSDKLDLAANEAADADMMLILGTSLVVQPAASLPFQTLRHGGSIVIVNDMPTLLDSYALARFDDLEEFFKNINKLV